MQLKYKHFFIVSLSLNILGMILFGLYAGKRISAKHATGGGYSDNPQYTAYLSMFELNEQKADVVFLGDSITARGRFEEFFPDVNLINRGIGSDTSEGVLHRLDEVTDRNPKKIFLMIGINDISKKIEPQITVENMKNILDLVTSKQENCYLYVLSILPTIKFEKKLIENLNNEYEKLSYKYTNCTYIDLYSRFTDSTGNVKTEYLSQDGVHLNGSGYKIYIDTISPYMDYVLQ